MKILLFAVLTLFSLNSFATNFTDNGNDTVTDSDTGLIWQKLEADHTPKNWEAALTYCEELNHANKTDWRLPDINELVSIVDYKEERPPIDTNYFPNTKSVERYWSSTTYTHDPKTAWSVYFFRGTTNHSLKTGDNYYVRCVR